MQARDLLDYLVIFVAGIGVGLIITMLLDEVERREAEAIR